MVIIFLFFFNSYLSFTYSFTFENKVNYHEILNLLNEGNSCDFNIQITNCSPVKEFMTKFTRYRDAIFVGSIFVLNCDLKINPLAKIIMKWELWKLEDRKNKVKDIVHKALFFMKEDSLDYGIYRLKLIVNVLFQSSNIQTKTRETECFFEIVEVGSQTIIYGGFIRSVNFQFNICFEVLTMLAPGRRALSKTMQVTYLWTCSDRGNQSSAVQTEKFCKEFETSEAQRLIRGPLASREVTPNPNDDLRVIKAYRFSLFTSLQGKGKTLYKVQTETQIVHITDHSGVNIGIICLLNCGGKKFRTNPQEIIHLEAKYNKSILKVSPAKEVRIVWLYQTDHDKEPMVVPMEAKCNDTLTEVTELRIKSDFLKENSSYLFYVKSIFDDKTLQTAAIKIFTSSLPSDITCTVHPANHIFAGIQLYNIFCSFTDIGEDRTSLMYEFYNKNNNSDNGRHLGFSMTGVLENVLLTRRELYVRITNLLGASSETKTEVILFSNIKFSLKSDLVEEINLVFGNYGIFLHNYNFRINLISAYWDILSNSRLVPAQFEVGELNVVLIKLSSEKLNEISGAIMLNNVVSNIIHIININDLNSFLKSESISILANLMRRVSDIVKDFTTDAKITSRLITTHRLYNITNAILKCSNFVLESKENYNLLESTNRNNLKKSISSMIKALRNILISFVSQQLYAINDMTIKFKNIEFKVYRLKKEERQLTKIHKNDVTILKLAPTTKVHLNMIALKKNPFWWSNGNKVNTDVKMLYLSQKQDSMISKLMLHKQIPFELKTHNFHQVTISGRVKQPNLHDSAEINDKIVAVYKIESEVNYLSFINFTYIQNDNSLRVVILQGLRPDFEYMTSSESKIITTNSTVIKFKMEDVKECNFFYIGILPGSNINMDEIVNYNFTIYSAACRAWKYGTWTKFIRCFIGNKSSEDVLVCHCPLINEIVGGQVFIPSHQFNPFSDFPLFISQRDYPWILVILIIIFLLYFLLLIWSRKEDKKDKQDINIIVLDDNDPHDDIAYLVGVFTGARLGASTTSKVGLKLFGEDGFSRSHILNSLHRQILKCNSDNWFLLVTPRHLGSLTDILLWTDHSGSRPNWYCSKIQVFDMVSDDNDFFFIESWFGTTAHEIHLETLNECATYNETNKISRIISENVLHGFMESHYWASVFFKHPRSPVTRTQRLSVVFCGALVNILVCILLYYPTSPQSVDFSSYATTKHTLTIGMIGSLAECVVSFVIIHCFYSCYSMVDSPVSFHTSGECHDMYHFGRNTTVQSSDDPKWFTILQSFIKKNLRPINALPLQSEKGALVGIEINKKKIKITFFLCTVIMIICSNFIIICGLQYDKIKMPLLYISVLFSIVQTNLMIIPIKIVTVAILLGCIKTRYYELTTFSIVLGKVLRTLRKKSTTNYKRYLIRLRNREIYKPPSQFKRQKLLPEYHRVVLELTVYYSISCICFLYVVIELIKLFNIRLYFLINMETLYEGLGTHGICETVYRFDLENIIDFWDFLTNSILPVLFTKTWYNGDTMSLPQELFQDTGWLKNGNSRLIGVPRLRQIREKPINITPCSVPEVMKNITSECHSALSADTEDREDYGKRWSNNSHWDVELFDVSPWKYTEPSSQLGYLRGPSGYLYHSGGYIATLHRDLAKSDASLSSLLDTNWIDDYTRVIVADFTIYNANTNVYTVTNIVTEYFSVGSVKGIYYLQSITLSSNLKSGALISVTVIVFILQLICLMNICGAQIFFTNVWDLFDCLILILFVYTTVLYWHWILRVSEDKEKLSKQGKEVYFQIEYIIDLLDYLKRMIGFLFSLMLFRLLRIIHFNKDIRTYTQDLLESRTEVFFGCLITVMLMFVQFRLIFLTTTPIAYSLKDVLIFRSQFKNIVRYKFHHTTGKVLAFMLNLTSQLGIFTLMLSQYHHFKKAQSKTRVKNLERKKERAESLLFGHK